jgi:hypothetical protein
LLVGYYFMRGRSSSPAGFSRVADGNTHSFIYVYPFTHSLTCLYDQLYVGPEGETGHDTDDDVEMQQTYALRALLTNTNLSLCLHYNC